MAAAANLTPVTLELGGKSPAIVGAGADLEQVAARLVMGKLLQRRPDLHRARLCARCRAARSAPSSRRCGARWRGMYPRSRQPATTRASSASGTYARLLGLLADAQTRGARVVPLHAGGMAGRRAGRVLAPALVLDTTEDMKIMQEEIFGPLLPVLAYDTLDEVIALRQRARAAAGAVLVRCRGRRARPAAVGHDLRRRHAERLRWHFGQEELPFGGVGASGMGPTTAPYACTFSRRSRCSTSRGCRARRCCGRRMGGLERMGRLLRLITRAAQGGQVQATLRFAFKTISGSRAAATESDAAWHATHGEARTASWRRPAARKSCRSSRSICARHSAWPGLISRACVQSCNMCSARARLLR